MKINVLRLPTAKCHEYKEGQPLKNFNLETFLHSTHNVSLIMCFSLLNSPILAITKYGIENQIQLTKNIKW